jgi:hypothetical protein
MIHALSLRPSLTQFNPFRLFGRETPDLLLISSLCTCVVSRL